MAAVGGGPRCSAPAPRRAQTGMRAAPRRPTSSVRARPGRTLRPAPDPGMTFIEAAPRCTTTRPSPARAGCHSTPSSRRRDERVLRPEGGRAGSSTPPTGPGVPATARPEPRCDGLVPWTGLLTEAFVAASRARRLVEGYLLTMPKQAGNQAPPESSAGTKVVTFGLVDLAAGDPGGLVDYLDAGFADLREGDAEHGRRCRRPRRDRPLGVRRRLGRGRPAAPRHPRRVGHPRRERAGKAGGAAASPRGARRAPPLLSRRSPVGGHPWARDGIRGRILGGS